MNECRSAVINRGSRTSDAKTANNLKFVARHDRLYLETFDNVENIHRLTQVL